MIASIIGIIFIAILLGIGSGIHWFFLIGVLIGVVISIYMICCNKSAGADDAADNEIESDGVKYYKSVAWCPSFGNICDIPPVKVSAYDDDSGKEMIAYEYKTPRVMYKLDEWDMVKKYYKFLSDKGFWYNPKSTDTIATFHKERYVIGININIVRSVLQIYPYIGDMYVDENGETLK